MRIKKVNELKIFDDDNWDWEEQPVLNKLTYYVGIRC